MELALARRFAWLVSEPMLAEYEGVLRRARFGFKAESVTRTMKDIRAVACLVNPRHRLKVTTDAEDNKVLECAWEGGADYLVTGNLRHFPLRFRGVQTVSPRQFQFILAAKLDS